jgi:O-succinylbenzoate synthase
MKIDRIEIFQICIPFKTPFRFGNTVQENRDHVVVAVWSDSMVGWGEGGLLRWPYYNAETTAGAYLVLRDVLAPLLIGRELNQPHDLQQIFTPVLGNKMAQAALDFAIWDLFAQQAGVPLSRYLGGAGAAIPVGISVGQRSTEQEFLDAVEGALQKGFRRVKCKVSPGFPVDLLHSVRRRHPNLLLSIDANGTFQEGDLNELRSYDSLSLAMIEQPFHPKEFLLSAELQRAMKTPICLDESIEDLHDVKLAGALQSGRIINIKPARVGGITSSIAIRDLAKTMGFTTWVGGLMETGIGRAANLAFASTVSQEFPHDIAECGRYCSEELMAESFDLSPSATINVPLAKPGLGVSVNRARLAEYAVDSSEMSA